MPRFFLNSPLGLLRIAADVSAISEILFVDEQDAKSESSDILIKAISQLTEYFEGKRQTFDLPLAPTGTSFQQNVWNELQRISFGTTCSYLDIAKSLGDPNAIRAVGAANGKNPIAIVIPCHRVIATNGKLTGYAGGLWRKEWLLNFESSKEQQELFPSK